MYDLEVVSLRGHYFQTGGLAYDKIGYQVSSMSEFRCRDPFGFVSSIFIP